MQVGRYGLEEKDFDFSAERVTASVHESLARLGLEYLDVVQAHDVEFGSLDQARASGMHVCWSVVRHNRHGGAEPGARISRARLPVGRDRPKHHHLRDVSIGVNADTCGNAMKLHKIIQTTASSFA